jgi:sucrose-6-phosphate hydrolase SacC (GH32 family)
MLCAVLISQWCLVQASMAMFGLTINTTASGAVPGHVDKFPVATKAFKVLASELAAGLLTLRVVVDRSIVEAFAQGGRAVVTATAYAPANASGLALWAEQQQGPADGEDVGNRSAMVVNATSWRVGCAWKEKI